MSSTTSFNIVNVNIWQPDYTALGPGGIPARTTPDSAVAGMQGVLNRLLPTNWPTTWAAIPMDQSNVGVMGPWSATMPGSSPQCILDQFNLLSPT